MIETKKSSSKTKRNVNVGPQAMGKNPNEKAKNVKGTIKRLIKLLFEYKFSMITIIVLTFLSILFVMFGPKVMGDAITVLSDGIMGKFTHTGSINFKKIGRLLIVFFTMFFIGAVLYFIQQFLMATVSQKVVRKLRGQVNGKLSRLPLSYFDHSSKGDILSRITNDIDNISNSLQMNITQLLSCAIIFVCVIIMMLLISPFMTLVCLITLPWYFFMVFVIGKRSKRYFRNQWNKTGELNGNIEEIYSGLKIIKAFGYEKKSIAEFDDINENLYHVSWKAQFISGSISPLMSLMNNIGYVFICVVGGIFVVRKTIAIGDITAFITYFKFFSFPIDQAANIINNLQSCIASAERVFSLLDEQEEIPEKSSDSIKEHKGTVEFENVSFSYTPDKPLIESTNLKVRPGETVAIVGPTGAGKTTIVNLLMRFYDVTSGKILVDGVDIRDIPRNDLRHIFGMVLQDTWLFKGTIFDNIAYGREGATLEEVEEAAKAARVHHFIMTLPDGYDTVIDENGSNISLGQRQLLTIARAILAYPEILILDEATSSVDTRTEILIQKAMSNLMKDRTSFVIAHRLSTIRGADAILVVKHGKIIEQGRHVELMEKNGFYAELYRSQFGGAKTADIV